MPSKIIDAYIELPTSQRAFLVAWLASGVVWLVGSDASMVIAFCFMFFVTCFCDAVDNLHTIAKNSERPKLYIIKGQPNEMEGE